MIAREAPTTHIIPTSWTKPPLSLNQRLNRWERREKVSGVRDFAHYASPAKLRGANLDHITVCLVWWVNDRRVRDTDNPVATLKALCDGLVDAGIVPDDRPSHMTKLAVAIRHRPASAGLATLELHITEGLPTHVRTARAILDDHPQPCTCDACHLADLVLEASE